MTIKVMLVDDHPVVRSGIRNRLNQETDIEVVVEAEDGGDVILLAMANEIDVLILDLNLPHLQPVPTVRKIKAQRPSIQVLILSAYYNKELVQELFRAGITGYVSKDEKLDTIIRGVRNVAQGHFWLSPQVTRVTVSGGANREQLSEQLTKRETEVIQLLARGLSNEAIGKELSISIRTVKFHVGNIYSKLNISSRSEAMLYAFQAGLVEL